MVLASSSSSALITLIGVAVFVFLLGRTPTVVARAAAISVTGMPAGENRDECFAAVQRWWTRRLVAIALGIALGSSASAVYVWWVGADRDEPAVDLLVLGAAAGAAWGCLWVGIGRRRLAPASGPRVAHAHRAALTGVAAIRLRVAAWVAVCAAAFLALIGAVVAAASPRFAGYSPVLPPSLIFVLLAIGSLVALELVGRLHVSVATKATNRAQLLSDDLVRWLVVRDLATAAAGLGLASILGTVPDLIINLNIPLGPGLARSLPWIAASGGAISLAAAAVYPVWTTGPNLRNSVDAPGAVLSGSTRR
jgi:hypothetical protein